MRGLALSTLLLLGLQPGSARAEPGDGGHVTTAVPEHRAADPEAPVVTGANLLDGERFWPYHVTLRQAWQPEAARRPLRAEARGVLIRVEDDGQALVDFGRDGRHRVPVGETDLVERANEVRRGELGKIAPNFLLAIGPRLVDSSAPELRPYRFRDAAHHRAFLCVFADVSQPGFAEVASALAPLTEREGLLTIVFPQGRVPDEQVRGRLRELEWTVPFVYDHLSEAYTSTLLEPGSELPSVLLQTGEGRFLFAGAWTPELVGPLAAALE